VNAPRDTNETRRARSKVRLAPQRVQRVLARGRLTCRRPVETSEHVQAWLSGRMTTRQVSPRECIAQKCIGRISTNAFRPRPQIAASGNEIKINGMAAYRVALPHGPPASQRVLCLHLPSAPAVAGSATRGQLMSAIPRFWAAASKQSGACHHRTTPLLPPFSAHPYVAAFFTPTHHPTHATNPSPRHYPISSHHLQRPYLSPPDTAPNPHQPCHQ
jgi:hypothetical protein